MFQTENKTPEDFPLIDISFAPVEIGGPYKTIACWSDLLGFGNQLSELNWDLSNDHKQLLIRRLVNFSLNVNERASHNEQSLFVNDGIIRTFDHNFYSINNNRNEILIWLESCIVSHYNSYR